MPRLQGTPHRRTSLPRLQPVRRVGTGGECPACSEIITITELLDIS
jgi:hypothetical protein